MPDREILLCKWQPELLAALVDLGARVYLVLDRYDRFDETAGGPMTARCERVYRIGSFDSLEELAAVAVDLRLRGAAVERVVSQSELSQSGARHLELLLGLGGDPVAHVAHRDKRLMKQRVRAAGVPAARFRSVPDPADGEAIAAARRDLGPRLVVKPAAGFGSMSTVRVGPGDDLAEVIAGFGFDPVLRSRQLIVEEWVTGEELAVDALWAGGRPLSFVVHGYHEPRLNMTDPSSMDGSRILPREDHQELYDRLLALQLRVNEALGITDHATHMEVFRRPDGELVFSEIANRVGGGWIYGMLGAHYGRSIWRVLAEVILHGTCPAAEPRRRYVGAVHVRPAHPGTITHFPADAELAAFPGVLGWWSVRKAGDRARLSHPSDFYLHIVLGADTEAELSALCARAVGRFAITTEPELRRTG
ncbi:ATP-grasp domain-containing protein [Amycolatopsis sp. NPDC005003]